MEDLSLDELKSVVKRLDKVVFGNGQPGLEAKLIRYIDERDAHKENNMKQMYAQLSVVQDQRHEENSMRFKRIDDSNEKAVEANTALSNKVSLGQGVMIGLQFLIMAALAAAALFHK